MLLKLIHFCELPGVPFYIEQALASTPFKQFAANAGLDLKSTGSPANDALRVMKALGADGSGTVTVKQLFHALATIGDNAPTPAVRLRPHGVRPGRRVSDPDAGLGRNTRLSTTASEVDLDLDLELVSLHAESFKGMPAANFINPTASDGELDELDELDFTDGRGLSEAKVVAAPSVFVSKTRQQTGIMPFQASGVQLQMTSSTDGPSRSSILHLGDTLAEDSFTEATSRHVAGTTDGASSTDTLPHRGRAEAGQRGSTTYRGHAEAGERPERGDTDWSSNPPAQMDWDNTPRKKPSIEERRTMAATMQLGLGIDIGSTALITGGGQTPGLTPADFLDDSFTQNQKSPLWLTRTTNDGVRRSGEGSWLTP